MRTIQPQGASNTFLSCPLCTDLDAIEADIAILAFDGHGPIMLVHVDAHIDWRNEVNGIREGYSSPIRRASELSHIDRIFQIGMRG